MIRTIFFTIGGLSAENIGNYDKKFKMLRLYDSSLVQSKDFNKYISNTF